MNMIQEELTLGLEAHKNQEFEAAAAHYQEILSEQPEHPETNHAVGLLLVANNQLADAIPFLFRALEHRPEVGHLWFDCLDAMIGAERWDEATHMIGRARQAGLPSDEIDFRELHVLHATLKRNLVNTANDTDDGFVAKAGVASSTVTIESTNSTLSGVRDAINAADS